MSSSPTILQISWGEIVVQGHGKFRDAKLWPGGAREWDWTETDTHHQPGIQIADVNELLEHGAREIILSRGMNLALQTADETVRHLEAEGIPYQILETKDAAAVYNNKVQHHVAVGGLFHSTC